MKTQPVKNLSSDADIFRRISPKDFDVRAKFLEMLQAAPIPREELLGHLVLFQDRRIISRILYANEIYQRIVNVHGNIFEFGVRYGPNLALLASLRGVYEPLNANRKIVGFDTFEGFPHVDRDHDSAQSKKGDFAVPDKYETYLEQVLALHEALGPLENLRRFELIKGDAMQTVKQYLRDHPETIISLAYFDLDLYEPTKECLKAILPYLNKGAVIAFDEINMAEFPGETIAFREVLGTSRFRLIHSPFRAVAAYLVYD
jgi:hypothetical protein